MSGCQKTPETVITNNPSENDTTFGDKIITEDGTTDPSHNITVVNITTNDIDEKIQTGDKTITFKGTISLPDRTDGLYTYRAIETDYDEKLMGGILINKSHIEIDGDGHVIDALNKAGVFNITGEYVSENVFTKILSIT